MSNIAQKNFNSELKFVYSDNDALSIIFKNNEVLLGVVGEFNNNLKELEKITKTKIYSRGNSILVKSNSKNNEVVHGIPTNDPLREGDIISIDCGVLKDGFYGDSAYTFAVGKISEEVEELLNTTKKCLSEGVNKVIDGNTIGDIGSNIEKVAKDRGYSIVKELVGHGIGKNLHEEPNVPNYGKSGKGIKLSKGLVIAVEPMLNIGSSAVCTSEDGWTVLTQDGSLSAHFEHTVAVGLDGPDILSDFEIIENEIKKIYG